ncbi:MAG: hypothetical protein MUF06_11205 [Pirellulaceae bacterium]|jgi:hypothetical protein|nr:hypothetical protein [Pirellulaceae bacterium]
MTAPNPSDDHTTAIGPRDGAILMLVPALGAAGYLCDAHSPLVQPLLPLFGMFFAGAGAALLGVCVYRAARRQ